MLQRRKDDVVTEVHLAQLLRTVHPAYRLANDGLSCMVAFARALLSELLAAVKVGADFSSMCSGMDLLAASLLWL